MAMRELGDRDGEAGAHCVGHESSHARCYRWAQTSLCCGVHIVSIPTRGGERNNFGNYRCAGVRGRQPALAYRVRYEPCMATPPDDGFGGLPPMQAPTAEQIAARQAQSQAVHLATHASNVTVPPIPSAVPPVNQPPPQLGPAGSMEMVGDKPYREYEIPVKALGDEWEGSGFEPRHLKFGLTQITVNQGIRAGRLMGAKMDIGTAFLEQQLMTIWVIGGEKCARNRDYKMKWMDAIGPGGRQVVEFCWNKINTRPDSEMEAVFEAGELKRG